MSTEEQRSLFAEDFLASHIPLPGSNEAQKMTAHSGRKCCESYAKYSQLGSLVKTLLESSQWNSTQCFLTWKVKATPAKRLLFQLVPSMPPTNATDVGSSPTTMWPTPTATEYKGARSKEAMEKTGRDPHTNSLRDAVEAQSGYATPKGKLSGSLNPEWVEWLMGFPIGHTDLKD